MIGYPELSGEERADVCVIGGGFTGVSAALNLAEKGFDVVLLESERMGFGASGRCGGLIGSGQRKDVLEVEEAFGLERSQQLWTFAEQAKQEVRDRVAKHDIPCDLQDGQLIGVHKRGYLGWAQELADALTERYAYPFCRALSAEETREYVATDDFLEGLYDPEAMASFFAKLKSRYGGGGGGPVGGYVPSPLLARGVNANHYCKIQIDGPVRRLTANKDQLILSHCVTDKFNPVRIPFRQITGTKTSNNDAADLVIEHF